MPLALIATVHRLSTWFEFLIDPASPLTTSRSTVGQAGGSGLPQLESGGFLANCNDKVHFLEKTDTKQLVAG